MDESTGALYAQSSLSEKVFEELEARILSNKIKPGEYLLELKISAELGVSRTPVREAIRMLEKNGLAQIMPHKGAIVLGVNEKDLEDIYTIRTYVEGLAARWAADNITVEQFRDLTEIVDLQEFYRIKGSMGKITELDSRFHEHIYKYSYSRPLHHVLSDLHHMVSWFREKSFSSEGRAEKAIEEHRQILEALKLHDGELAEKLMVDHIANAKNNLLDILKREKEESDMEDDIN